MGFSEAVNNDVTRCYLEGIPCFNQYSVHVVRLEPRGTILHHPLSPPNIITNTQEMVASVQTSSTGINLIAEGTVAPIQLQVTSTNDPMVIIRAKGSTQQPSRNILLRVAAYDTVRKRTVLPLQEIKRETMMIHQQKKEKLGDEDANTRINLNSTSGIYLTADVSS